MTFISEKHHRAKPNRSLPLGEFAFMLQGHCVPGLSVGLYMNEYFNSTISFSSVISHNGIPKDFKMLFLCLKEIVHQKIKNLSTLSHVLPKLYEFVFHET